MNISGGTVGNGFEAFIDVTVNITGGTVGDDFEVKSDSTVNISDGTVGSFFHIGGRAGVANISGGTVGDSFIATGSSKVNISGGTVGDGFEAYGSEINLFVTELALDGVPVALIPGQKSVITERGGALLEATLADGSFFDFILNDRRVSGEDFIEFSATLTATLVPEPGALGLICFGSLALLARRRRGTSRTANCEPTTD